MTNSSTMTIRLSTELKDRLERVAVSTKRSKSWLAGEAIEAYVDRELKIVEGIEQALEEMDTQPGIPHDDMMAEALGLITAAEARKAAKPA